MTQSTLKLLAEAQEEADHASMDLAVAFREYDAKRQAAQKRLTMANGKMHALISATQAMQDAATA